MASRGLLVALGVAAGVVLAGGCNGSKDDAGGRDAAKPLRTVRAKLRLERAGEPGVGNEELVVSLPDQRLNTLDRTGGETSVLLRCADSRGKETIRQSHDWPLQEEEGFSPHVHQAVRPQVLKGVRSCRMTGKGIDFTASVRGPVPPIK